MYIRRMSKKLQRSVISIALMPKAIRGGMKPHNPKFDIINKSIGSSQDYFRVMISVL